MYYVYFGYINSDNCGDHPTHSIKKFSSKEEIIKFWEEFNNEKMAYNDENQEVYFRIFEGIERFLTPVQVIKKWELI